MLSLSQQLSQDIISRAKETKNLANDQGGLEMPFNLSGKLPGAKPNPDVGYIARAMGKGAVERGLEGLLQKKSPKGGSETSPAQPHNSNHLSLRKKRKKVLRRTSSVGSKNGSESKALLEYYTGKIEALRRNDFHPPSP